MTTALESAMRKLADGDFEFGDLPSDRNANLWERIEKTYGLTLQEVSALQNARCPPTTGKPRHSSRISLILYHAYNESSIHTMIWRFDLDSCDIMNFMFLILVFRSLFTLRKSS